MRSGESGEEKRGDKIRGRGLVECSMKTGALACPTAHTRALRGSPLLTWTSVAGSSAF